VSINPGEQNRICISLLSSQELVSSSEGRQAGRLLRLLGAKSIILARCLVEWAASTGCIVAGDDKDDEVKREDGE
jgi:hypothetical protein